MISHTKKRNKLIYGLLRHQIWTISYRKALFQNNSFVLLPFITKQLYLNMEHPLKYWCFACQKHFQSERELVACSLCKSEAIQKTQANHSEDPSQFSVYRIENQQQATTSQSLVNQNQYANSQNQAPLGTSFFVPLQFQQMTMNLSLGQPSTIQQMFINNNLNNIFQQLNTYYGVNFNLLNTLIGRNNLIPASQQQINRLQRIEKVNFCTICHYEEQNQQQIRGYKLGCGHCFHIECLNPWLLRTNTCPTCRARI